jgi:Holliday junction resolvase RusA-like endonuclease
METQQINDTFVYHGDIMAKPRMTQSDKWKKRTCTQKYWSFKDELLLQSNSCNFVLSDAFEVFAFIKMPKSWSLKKKKAMNLIKHQNKPDADNILKSINDIFGKKDQSRWSNTVHKFWSEESFLVLINKLQEEIDMIETKKLEILKNIKYLKND